MTSTVTLLPALSADFPLDRIAGIGPKQLQRLEKLGILTVRDLLFHLPRRYEDTRELVPLSELQAGAVQTARVRVRNVSQRRSPRKRMVLVQASLEDDGDVVSAVWFNQPFISHQLQSGMELVVSGKVQQARGGLEFRNPAFERVGAEQLHVGVLAPVYPETQGLTSKFLRSRIEPLLALADSIPDAVPEFDPR